MKLLDDSCYITEFSADHAPVFWIHDGETFQVVTQDCYMNRLRAQDDPRGPAEAPAIGCNPATGPIFVEGAQPGDTLKCEILSIDVGEYASMRISNRGGFMKEHVTAPIVRAIALKDGAAQLSGVRIPLEPMIGVIGVAPFGAPVGTETPGAHGGNMDTRLIGAGSTLYLPVFHEGGLLALGDVHAQMGDGEVCICGLECPARVTLRVSVIKGRREAWPILEREGAYYAICSAVTLDEASRLAADQMLHFLERRVNVPHNELILLMSLICDLQICQVVDPLLTVRMGVRAGIFHPLSF